MSTILEIERIQGVVGFGIKVVLVENILTDDTTEEPSRTYDIETYFYKKENDAPAFSLVDASACNLKEANKIFKAICSGLSVLIESEVQ